VVSREIVLSVLILTEDGAGDAHDTLVALVKKAFQLLQPGCRTNRIRFDPQGETERRYMVANLWKGEGPKTRAQRGQQSFRRIDLFRAVATRLLEDEPTGFVLVHVDGDRPWSRRDESENRQKYRDEFVAGVRAVLRASKPEREQQGMARLLSLVPFYSIEAWLYQNLATAQDICAELGNPPELVRQLEAWRADRARVDEEVQIKDRCPLGDRHNKRLATTAWPAAVVHAIGCSFHDAVEGLRRCDDLRAALTATTT
jgi:hypothetical protein